MTNNPLQQPDDTGADVTADSPLPDIPDAGDGSQPIASPDPVDFSTAGITADAALVAGTLNDGDERTLYEQAIDTYEANDADLPPVADASAADQTTSESATTSGHARIYDSNR